MKNGTNMKLDKDVQFLIIGSFLLVSLVVIGLKSGQKLQILIIDGIILVLLATIWTFGGKKLSMKSHHKIQVVGLLGLTSIAIIALILVAILYYKDTEVTTAIIAIASTAVGGIAGFITHKVTLPNRTVLLPISDPQTVVADKELKFTLNGQSSANYNLKYTMISTPELPETAELDDLSGEFKFKPSVDAEANTYNVVFTVTDGQGTSDSRSVKIIVVPKPN